jgi:hypothetical protein
MRSTLLLWRLPWHTDFAFIFRNSTFTGLSSIRAIVSGNKDKDDPMTPLGISPKRTPVPNPFVLPTTQRHLSQVSLIFL